MVVVGNVSRLEHLPEEKIYVEDLKKLVTIIVELFRLSGEQNYFFSLCLIAMYYKKIAQQGI